MTKRKEDDTPPRPGGRAAERLRQFEEARGLRKPGQPAKKKHPQREEPEAGELGAPPDRDPETKS